VTEGTASRNGDDFFYSLVRHLASALQVRYAFVAKCIDARKARVGPWRFGRETTLATTSNTMFAATRAWKSWTGPGVPLRRQRMCPLSRMIATCSN